MNKPKRQLLAFCWAAVLLIGVLAVVDTTNEFQRRLAMVDAELGTEAELLAEHAWLSFRGADILLNSVVAAFAGNTSPQILVQSPVLEARLQSALEYVPQLSTVAILDASGAVRLWVGGSSASEFDVPGAEVVNAHQNGQPRYIGKALVGRESGQRLIPVSFRILSADGEFYGAVLAFLDAAYFDSFHSQLNPSGTHRIGMYLENSEILTLSPARLWDVEREADGLNTLFNSLPGNSYVKPSPLDGSKRIMALYGLEDYPVSISISVDYRSFIESFYGFLIRRVVAVLALILAVRICYKAIRRSIDTHEELREKRVERLQDQRRFERLSREIIHHIPNGRAALLDPELRYIFADGKAFSEHERLAPARLLGKTIREVHRPEVADLLEELVENALAGTEAQAEVISIEGVFYEVTAVPLRDEQEQVDRVLLLSQDITSFHRARQTLEERNQKLHEISFTDALLDISNRRALDTELEREWARAQRAQESLSMLMIDVDHFKIYNDTYGHTAGDRCLRQVAEAIREAVFRPGDMVARYGGEELVVLMPATDRVGALEVAERIHLALESRAIPFPNSPIADRVTLSIGVAAKLPNKDEPACSIVQLADAALYRAKQTGRNRTVESEQGVDMTIGEL